VAQSIWATTSGGLTGREQNRNMGRWTTATASPSIPSWSSGSPAGSARAMGLTDWRGWQPNSGQNDGRAAKRTPRPRGRRRGLSRYQGCNRQPRRASRARFQGIELGDERRPPKRGLPNDRAAISRSRLPIGHGPCEIRRSQGPRSQAPTSPTSTAQERCRKGRSCYLRHR
jgi:hypothetical protein